MTSMGDELKKAHIRIGQLEAALIRDSDRVYNEKFYAAILESELNCHKDHIAELLRQIKRNELVVEDQEAKLALVRDHVMGLSSAIQEKDQALEDLRKQMDALNAPHNEPNKKKRKLQDRYW